jgi:hypothetical protein
MAKAPLLGRGVASAQPDARIDARLDEGEMVGGKLVKAGDNAPTRFVRTRIMCGRPSMHELPSPQVPMPYFFSFGGINDIAGSALVANGDDTICKKPKILVLVLKTQSWNH